MKIGLETESLHLWFQNKRMDIFGFIELAHELGLDGVQINLIKDYNLDENWGTLGSNDIDHLKKVKNLIKKYDMYVELDIRNLEYDRFVEVIEVAKILGADNIRSYVPIKINRENLTKNAAEGLYDIVKVKQDFEPESLIKAIEDIKRILPLLEESRIKLCLENHEYETSEELVSIVEEINSPFVGLLYDFGNSMMAWEEPIKAAKNMAKYTYSTHLKDHIIIPDEKSDFSYVVCGVPVGEGNVEIKEIYDILYKNSPIRRVNIEMCYPYCAEFKRSLGTGGVNELGKGAFKIEKPIYDIPTNQYYYPHEISNDLLERMLVDQMEGVKKSVAFVKKMIKEK